MSPPQPAMKPAPARSAVKGMYFVTARQYLLDHDGPEALARVVAAMPAAHQYTLLDPLASDWYPEEALHDALVAVWTEICQKDEARFLELLEECTRIGTHRFFRVLLGITTPRFLLRHYPTLVKQLRRGSVQIETDVRDGDATVRVTELDFADDRLYQLAFIAGFNVLFDAMLSRRPKLRVHGVTARGFVIEVDWRIGAT